MVLVIGSIYVIKEAIGRILAPEPTNAEGMLLFAIIGITVNGYAAWKLSGGKSMNEKVGLARGMLMEDDRHYYLPMRKVPGRTLGKELLDKTSTLSRIKLYHNVQQERKKLNDLGISLSST